MSVSIEKIQGVESVQVRLNEGKATVQLKPGNAVSLDQLQRVIQKNGFTPQQTTVTARVEVLINNGEPQLKVPGPNVMYEVAGPHDTEVQEGLKKAAGKTLIVEGVIPAPGKGKVSEHVIQVKTFKPESSGR